LGAGWQIVGFVEKKKDPPHANANRHTRVVVACGVLRRVLVG